MLPVWFFLVLVFQGKSIVKTAKHKQELALAAISVAKSGRNETDNLEEFNNIKYSAGDLIPRKKHIESKFKKKSVKKPNCLMTV